MDIAFVVRKFDRRGGIARYTTELAERLSRTNSVTVYTAAWDAPPGAGIRFVRVPFVTSSFLHAHQKHASNTMIEVASFMMSAARIVRSERHDILHNQGDLARGCDVLTAHSCHKAWLRQARRDGGTALERLRKSRANPLHAIVLHAEHVGMTQSARIIAVSERVRLQIVEHYGISEERIVVIPNGVDTTRFHPENRQRVGAEMRAAAGIDPGEVVAIFPAHEFRRKGLGVLIEALHRIPLPLSLLVVGRDDPAPYRAQIERHGLRGRVRFVGDASAIERWFAAADLMVFPTTYEPFGLVITEAMASGLPVVTSREAGAADLITDGESGLLIDDPTDVDEVAAAVRALLDDPALRMRIGTRARERALLDSWDRIAGATFEVYREVAREKSSGPGRAVRQGNGTHD